MVHLLALIDGYGIPFYPIELSALLTTFYMRKAIFLACITPISVMLWVLRADNWQLKGMGVSLFLMSLFDEGNEWPLHMLGVVLFGVCLFHNTVEQRKRSMLMCVIALYGARITLRTLYLYIYETHGRSKEIAATGCSGGSGIGYTYCAHPELTQNVLKTVASLQWGIFILLSVIVTE
jgi:hypothetical protein